MNHVKGRLVSGKRFFFAEGFLLGDLIVFLIPMHHCSVAQRFFFLDIVYVIRKAND